MEDVSKFDTGTIHAALAPLPLHINLLFRSIVKKRESLAVKELESFDPKATPFLNWVLLPVGDPCPKEYNKEKSPRKIKVIRFIFLYLHFIVVGCFGEPPSGGFLLR